MQQSAIQITATLDRTITVVQQAGSHTSPAAIACCGTHWVRLPTATALRTLDIRGDT